MWSDYGVTTVVAVATAALIAHLVALPGGSIARALAWRPAAAVGRVSYGIYLYHWPIVAALSAVALPFFTRLGLEYALTAAAVLVSWFAIERPALRRKGRFIRTRVELVRRRRSRRGADDRAGVTGRQALLVDPRHDRLRAMVLRNAAWSDSFVTVYLRANVAMASSNVDAAPR